MELAQLESALKNECQVAIDQPLVVGVSGGPDSLCLLDSLHRLGIPLLAAHFDHGLRDESAEEARLVAALVKEMGVPFHLARSDVRALAVKEGLTIEEAARKARYRFLFRTARDNQAQAVAVAHTADDQVEKVLMHLLRGAGLSGLKGAGFGTKSMHYKALGGTQFFAPAAGGVLYTLPQGGIFAPRPR